MNNPEFLPLVAIWNFLRAIPSFVGALAIMCAAFPSVASNTSDGVGLLFALIGLFIGWFLLMVIGVGSIFTGIGLLRKRASSRIYAIGFAILDMFFFFPVSTIIGAGIIYYLVQDEVKAAFIGGGSQKKKNIESEESYFVEA